MATAYHILHDNHEANLYAEGKKFATLNEKYLNIAEKLLYTEMAFALKTEKDTIKRKVIEELSHLPLETA